MSASSSRPTRSTVTASASSPARASRCFSSEPRSPGRITSSSTATATHAGLRVTAIPLAGRIVAVADVFDALVSDRVYRQALPIEEVIAAMRAERGAFDPDALEALLTADSRGAQHPRSLP